MSADLSVLIPCRNEARDIADCICAIAAQELDRSAFEVILIDGESTDGTVEIARRAALAHGLELEVLTNPDRTAGTALNQGLRRSNARLIVRVDARSRITPGHLKRCRSYLEDPAIGAVGGGQRAVVRPQATLEERGIVRALSNRYTTGLASYRRSKTAGPVDTVWMGAFRRDDLERVGGWPVYPEQNQDYRLNQALRDEGLQVWFDPALTADYLPRRTYGDLARQHLAFGRAKGTIWRSGEALSPRHVLLLSAPPVVGLALLGLARRHGALRAGAIGALGLVAIDELGGSAAATLPERVAAIIATVVADGAWFLGALQGLFRR